MDRLSLRHDRKPFAASSLTEEYEMGLRLGALGYRTMFVRLPTSAGSHAVVASRGHFPAALGPAVRQKARWLRGIALSGWERLGWRGGLGERWFRMRDRRGPLAALVIVAAYLALFLWLQLWLARALGAPVDVMPSPLLAGLLQVNAALLVWRLAMRFAFTARAYGWVEGLRAIPRSVVGNFVAVLAARRALDFHARRDSRWEKTAHRFEATPA